MGLLITIEGRTEDTGFDVRPVKPQTIDYGIIRSWLHFCSENHTDACKPANIRIISGFQVIDCNIRTVIDAPSNCRYVALSYVWGEAAGTPESASTETESDLLSDVPKVISDSMEVVLRLGMEYLWVDRYCIDQSNPKEKHDQIRNMDSIYASAEMTIVAAAGSEAHHGLPGVSTRRRLQPQTQIRGRHFASTLPRYDYTLDQSVWATRGWTYQEGVLSRRRVIFLEDQVAFECNGIGCNESTAVSLEDSHHEDQRGFRSDRATRAFFGTNRGGNRTLFGESTDAMEYIATYSSKQLSYPVDKLNAMQGIFGQFSREGRSALHQIAGIVLLDKHNIESSFLAKLTWSHDSPGQRQRDFPSWSWTGWSSSIRSKLYDLGRKESVGTYMSFTLEERNGAMHTLPLVLEDIPPLSRRIDNTARYLHLEAFAFSPCFVDHNQAAGRSLTFNAKLILTPSHYASVTVYSCEAKSGFAKLDQTAGRATATIAIALGNVISGSYMLVEERGDCFERVGLMRVRSNDLFEKQGGTYTKRKTYKTRKDDFADCENIFLSNMTRRKFRIG